MNTDSTKTSGTSNKQSAKDTANDMKNAAQDAGKDLKSKAKAKGSSLADQAYDAADSKLEEGKAEAISQIDRTAEQIRNAGHEFGDDSYQAQAAEYLASNLSQAADMIRNKDLGAIVDDVTLFARRNPALFLGGAALLGFAAARMMKASDRHGSGSSYDMSSNDRSSYDRGSYDRTSYDSGSYGNTPYNRSSSAVSPSGTSSGLSSTGTSSGLSSTGGAPYDREPLA